MTRGAASRPKTKDGVISVRTIVCKPNMLERVQNRTIAKHFENIGDEIPFGLAM